MLVEDFMTRDVITVDVDTSVKEAVRLMNEYEIGCLIVVKSTECVGIITERDLLKRVIAESRNPETTKVSEIMSKPLIVGSTHMELEDAARLMFKRKIKKLPIVEDGRLKGLITLTDIARSAQIEPQMIRIIRELSNSGWLPPKGMKNIIELYVS